MKHEWLTTAATISKSKHRICLNCGAQQSYFDHYDRLIGTRYEWSPKVGRCKNEANTSATEHDRNVA